MFSQSPSLDGICDSRKSGPSRRYPRQNKVTSELFLFRGNLSVAEAAYQVVIDHTGGLHQRIANRRADKPEPAFLQILAQGIRLRRLRGHLLMRFPGILPRPTVHESPNISIKRSEFSLHIQKRLCIRDGCTYFQFIADDAWVAQ